MSPPKEYITHSFITQLHARSREKHTKLIISKLKLKAHATKKESQSLIRQNQLCDGKPWLVYSSAWCCLSKFQLSRFVHAFFAGAIYLSKWIFRWVRKLHDTKSSKAIDRTAIWIVVRSESGLVGLHRQLAGSIVALSEKYCPGIHLPHKMAVKINKG